MKTMGKKIISMVLLLSMLMTMMPMEVLAANVSGKERPHVALLEEGGSGGGSSQGEPEDNPPPPEGGDSGGPDCNAPEGEPHNPDCSNYVPACNCEQPENHKPGCAVLVAVGCQCTLNEAEEHLPSCQYLKNTAECSCTWGDTAHQEGCPLYQDEGTQNPDPDPEPNPEPNPNPTPEPALPTLQANINRAISQGKTTYTLTRDYAENITIPMNVQNFTLDLGGHILAPAGSALVTAPEEPVTPPQGGNGEEPGENGGNNNPPEITPAECSCAAGENQAHTETCALIQAMCTCRPEEGITEDTYVHQEACPAYKEAGCTCAARGKDAAHSEDCATLNNDGEEEGNTTPVCNCEKAEGEDHKETCAVIQEICTCKPDIGITLEEYKHGEGCPARKAEGCNCLARGEAAHTEGCGLYEAPEEETPETPEEPVCTCDPKPEEDGEHQPTCPLNPNYENNDNPGSTDNTNPGNTNPGNTNPGNNNPGNSEPANANAGGNLNLPSTLDTSDPAIAAMLAEVLASGTINAAAYGLDPDALAGVPALAEAPQGDPQTTINNVSVFGNLTIINGTIDGTGMNNARGVLVTSGGNFTLGEGATIQNFTVASNGAGINADGTGRVTILGAGSDSAHPERKLYNNKAPNGMGGGIYIYTGDNLTISVGENTSLGGMTLSHNEAKNGGAIAAFAIRDNTEGLNNLTLRENTATALGGAIYVGSLVTNCSFTNVTFDHNRAANGGGLYVTEKLINVAFTNLLLDGNSATDHGGAFYLKSAAEKLSFTDSRMIHNRAARGGAIYSAWNPGGNIATRDTTVTMTNCTISDNRVSEYGGAFFITRNAKLTWEKCLLDDNHSNYEGGGLYGGAYIDLLLAGSDNVLTNNTAVQCGGAVRITTSGGITMEGGEVAYNKVYNIPVENGYSTGAGLVTDGLLKINGGILHDNISDYNAGAGYGGTIEINGGEFYDNQAGYQGGAIYAGSGGVIRNGLFRNNTAGSWGGAVRSGGTLTVQLSKEAPGSSITMHNNKGSAGGAIAGGAVVIHDGQYYENTAGAGGAIYGDSTVTIYGGEYFRNTDTHGAISTDGWQALNFHNGKVYENHIGIRGNHGSVNVYGGEIYNNSDAGVALTFNGLGTATITGGYIHNNGGAGVWTGINFNRGNNWYSTANIGGNAVITGNLGGVVADIVKVSGNAQIFNNATAADGVGGGVRAVQFTMDGGAIFNNSAYNGGGVYLDGGWYNGIPEQNQIYSTMNITGGKLRNNTAYNKGNDIYADTSTALDRPEVTFTAVKAADMATSNESAYWLDEVFGAHVTAPIQERHFQSTDPERQTSNIDAYTFMITEPVASIGTVKYITLQQAFDAIQSGTASGKYIKMLKGTSENVVFPNPAVSAGGTLTGITLDLMGYQVTCPSGTILTLGEGADVTLTDTRRVDENLEDLSTGPSLDDNPDFTDSQKENLRGLGALTGATTGAVEVGTGATFTVAAGGNVTGNARVDKLEDNTISALGGGVRVLTGGKLILDGGRISRNRIVNSTNANADLRRGAGVWLQAGASMELKSGMVSENTGNYMYGGGIYAEGEIVDATTKEVITPGAKITMTGGSISGNKVYGNNSYGGGVFLGTGAVMDMSGGTIEKNTANDNAYAAGILTNGTFNLSGGTIRQNSVSRDDRAGGAVYVAGTGVMNMTGGSIEGNRAGYGGGVYVWGNNNVTGPWGVFNMSGGEIKGNTADKTSGGIHNWAGKVNMSGTASVIGNKAGTGGGGVYVEAQFAEFAMTGGSISDNSTTTGVGGGMYIYSAKKISLTGGTVANNASQTYGGGIYVSEYCWNGDGNDKRASDYSFAGVKVYANSATSGNGNDIYFNYATDSANITGLSSPAAYGVKVTDPDGGEKDAYDCWRDDVTGAEYGVKNSGATVATLSTEMHWRDSISGSSLANKDEETAAKTFYKPIAMGITATLSQQTSGQSDKVAYTMASYVVTPEATEDNPTPESQTVPVRVEFDSLAQAMAAVNAGTVAVVRPTEDASGNMVPMPPESVTTVTLAEEPVIFLMKNVSEDVTAATARPFTLDLNGWTLTNEKNQKAAYTVPAGANMTLRDTQGNFAQNTAEGARGTVTKSGATVTAQGFHVTGGTLNMQSGYITGFKIALGNGEAIGVEDGGTVNISGGEISGNTYTGTGLGGAVYCGPASTLQITAGTFKNNQSVNTMGGAVVVNGGTLRLTDSAENLDGVLFEGNTALNGGAIYITGAADDAVTITGGTFRSNSATGTTDIWNSDAGERASTGHGGAIYIMNSGKMVIRNGQFLRNTSRYTGGAVASRSTELQLLGSRTLFDGNTSNYGGAMYIYGFGSTKETLIQLDDNAPIAAGTGTSGSSTPDPYQECNGDHGPEPKEPTEAELAGLGVFRNNSSNVHAGAIYIREGKLRVENGNFTQNTSTLDGAVIGLEDRNTMTVTLNGGILHHNTSKRHGGAIAKGNNGTLTLDGNVRVCYNTAINYGGGISGNYQTVTGNAMVDHNHSNTNGGGMSGITTLSGHAQICYNNASVYGGGISGDTTMMGNSIVHHNYVKANYTHTWSRGGGISGSVLLKENAIVCSNELRYTSNQWDSRGGGINGGKVEIYGNAQVCHNVSGSYAGAIFVERNELIIGTPKTSATAVNTERLSIHDNSAEVDGGGIYAYDTNTQINAGTFTRNESKGVGGAICVYDAQGYARNIIIRGGEFFDNYAESGGGGIYTDIYYGAVTVRIYGDVSVHNNSTGGYGGGIAVCNQIRTWVDKSVTPNVTRVYKEPYYFGYWGYTADPIYTGAPSIYDNRAALGQDYYQPQRHEPHLIKGADVRLPAGYEANGWLDETLNRVIEEPIQGELDRYYALTLVYSKNDIVAKIPSVEQGFPTVQDAVTYLVNHPNLTDKTVVMVRDSIEQVAIPSSVDMTLNLNGHKLEGLNSAIVVQGKINIVDEKNTSFDNPDQGYGAGEEGEGYITGNTNASGGGIKVLSGEAKLTSGTIKDCRAATSGAAVYVYSGKFTLAGGTIKDNYAPNGSAVYVDKDGSTFAMTAGTISKNRGTTANVYDGAIYNNGGAVSIAGGTISDNTTRATIFNTSSGTSNGRVNISGGVIENNTTVYSPVTTTGTRSSTIISGTANEKPEIRNNYTSASGGAVSVLDGTTYISNAVIRGNTAVTYGGGIYQSAGTLIMDTGTEVTNNEAQYRGGGIFQWAGNATLVSGTVVNNEAPRGGGVAQEAAYRGNMVISNGTKIYENVSLESGSGNDIYSHYDNTVAYKEWINISANDRAKMTIEPANEMHEDKYNVWRVDDYSGSNFGVTENKALGDGALYVSGAIEGDENLLLTAYFYELEKDPTPLATDYKVVEAYFKPDSMISGTFPTAELKKVVPAEEKTAKNAEGLVQTTETYQTSHQQTKFYLRDPESGKMYEQNEMYSWKPGDDGSQKNTLVMTNDQITHTIYLLIEKPKKPTTEGDGTGETGTGSGNTGTDSGSGDSGSKDAPEKIRVWVEVELDNSMSEARMSVPSGWNGYVTVKEENGNTIQLLRCYKEIEVTQSDNIDVSVITQVRDMKNGDKIKPRMRAWVDGNEENAAHPITDQADKLTVSAVGRYNVTLQQNEVLAKTGDFNVTKGTAYDHNKASAGDVSQFGTILGYGVTVSLYNDTSVSAAEFAEKGIRGIELPADGLELQVRLRSDLFLEGAPLVDKSTNKAVSIAPDFWAYKENKLGNTGRPFGSTSESFNMDWNDEDDKDRTTAYAFNAAPFNTGNNARSCYQGGSWELLKVEKAQIEDEDTQSSQQETILTFRVNGYAFNIDGNTDTDPSQNSNGIVSDYFSNTSCKAFSAGYFQMLYPFPKSYTTDPRYNGYLSIESKAVASDLKITSVSGRNPDESSDYGSLLAYFGDKETSRPHATNEMRFQDNYVSTSNGLYIDIDIPSTGEPYDGIALENVYMTGTNGPIAEEKGTGLIALGNDVYIGARGNFTSVEYKTDEEKLFGNSWYSEYYIPDAEFNSATDNKVEYNYLTAINMLQKFDAEVFTPKNTSYEIVDRRVSQGSYLGVDNNNPEIYVGGTESEPYWNSDDLVIKYNPNATTTMRLTVLYAAKPDGTNWIKQTRTAEQLLGQGAQWVNGDPATGKIRYDGNIYSPTDIAWTDGGVNDMQKYHEEQLLYFKSMKDLHDYLGKDAKCVAVLYEGRDCCIRTGNKVIFECKMSTTDDFSKTGKTYATTNDTRIWTTYRPDYRTFRDQTWETRQTKLFTFSWNDVSYNGKEGCLARGLALGEYKANGEWEPANKTYLGKDHQEKLSDAELGDRATGYADQKLEGVNRRNGHLENLGTDESPNMKVVWDKYTKDVQLTIRGYTNSSYPGRPYIKTEYAYGSQKGGTHVGGWYRGNSIMLHTLESQIYINGDDKANINSDAIKTVYDLSKSERIAKFRIDPELHASSQVSSALVTDGSQSTTVNVMITLPEGLTYQKGSIAFDYTPEIDPETKRPKPTYTDGELTWTIGEPTVDPVTHKTVIIVSAEIPQVSKRDDTTYRKELPDITFAGFIEDLPSNAQVKPLKVSAGIFATYEEHNALASTVQEAAFTITALRPDAVGLYQTSLEFPLDDENTKYSILTELGEDYGYNLNFYNSGTAAVSGVTFADVLPYNGDQRGTEFTGGYDLNKIRVVFDNEDDANDFVSEDNGGKLYLAGMHDAPTVTNMVDGMGNPVLDTDEKPVKTAASDEQQKAAYAALFEELKTKKENHDTTLTEVPKEKRTAVEKKTVDGKTYWVVTYDVSGMTEASKSYETQGKTFFVELGSVRPGATVKVQPILNNGRTTGTGASAVTNPIPGADASDLPGGGSLYTNSFGVVYTDKSQEPPTINTMRSLTSEVLTVQRVLSGFAFLDMNHDGRFAQGKDYTADVRLPKMKVTLYNTNADGTRGARANDIWGKPCVTVTDNAVAANQRPDGMAYPGGYYEFRDLKPETYVVVFEPLGTVDASATDPDVKYPVDITAKYGLSTEDNMEFRSLSVTKLPGTDTDPDYYKTAADANRCVPVYRATPSTAMFMALSDENSPAPASETPTYELVAAELYGARTMPARGTLQVPVYTDTNNNAGFYYVKARVQQDWTNMVMDVPTGVQISFNLTAKVGNEVIDTGEDTPARIIVRQDSGWNKLTAYKQNGEPLTGAVPDAQKLTATVSSDPTLNGWQNYYDTIPSYTWLTSTINLKAETKMADGKIHPIDYSHTMSVSMDGPGANAKEAGYTIGTKKVGTGENAVSVKYLLGYDDPVTSKKLDENTGITTFKAVNNQRMTDMDLEKVWKDGEDAKPLKGAQFQVLLNDEPLTFYGTAGSYHVYIDNGGGDIWGLGATTVVQVNDVGALSLKHLPECLDGTERTLVLKEVKAPNGFVLPHSGWNLLMERVNKATVIKTSYEEGKAPDMSIGSAPGQYNGKLTQAESNNDPRRPDITVTAKTQNHFAADGTIDYKTVSYKFRVWNERGFRLPVTGGEGVTGVLGFGSLMIAAGAVLLLEYKKRKRMMQDHA